MGSNFIFKYKLVVIREATEDLPEHIEYIIGNFYNEEHLKQWAEQNNGELKKSFEEDVLL